MATKRSQIRFDGAGSAMPCAVVVLPLDLYERLLQPVKGNGGYQTLLRKVQPCLRSPVSIGLMSANEVCAVTKEPADRPGPRRSTAKRSTTRR